MRWLLFMLLPHLTIAIDVMALFAANTATPIQPPSLYQSSADFATYWRKYNTPLDPRIMPTCGDGIIQKGVVTQGKLSDFPGNTVPLPFQFTADEMCDDGNRLDGDGCSADCLDVDAIMEPCQLLVDRQTLRYESILEANDQILAVAADGIYSMTQTMNGLTTALLQNKTFNTSGAFWFQSTVYLFAYPSAAIYTYTDGSMQQKCPPSTTPSQGISFFFNMSNNVYVLAMTNTVAVVYNVSTCKPVSYALTSAIPPCTSGSLYEGVVSLRCGSVGVLYPLGQSVTLTSTPMPLTGDLWSDAFVTAVYPSAIVAEDPANIFSNLSALSVSVSFSVYSTTAYARFIRSVRGAFIGGGSDLILMGSQLSLLSTLGGQDQCSPTTACALQLPIAYSIINPNGSGITYLQALAQAAGNITAFATSVPKSPVNSMVNLRNTRVSWLLAGNQLWEIARSGVQVQQGGMCWPSTLGVCKSCFWALDGTACKPCTSPAMDNRSQLAFAIQCQQCNTTSGSRRLLASSVTVTMQVKSNTSIPGAVCANGICLFSISSQDPQGALRNLTKLVSQNPTWRITSHPKVVYKPLSTPIPTTTPPPAPVISLISIDMTGVTLNQALCAAEQSNAALSTLYGAPVGIIAVGQADSQGNVVPTACPNYQCPCIRSSRRLLFSMGHTMASHVYSYAQTPSTYNPPVASTQAAMKKVLPTVNITQAIQVLAQQPGTTTSTQLPAYQSLDSWNSALSVGAIVAIVIGGVVFLAIVVVSIWYFGFHRDTHEKSK